MSNIIKEKVTGIQDALKAMIHSDESGSGFDKLKKNVADKIRETEEAADTMMGLSQVDVGENIRGKMKEIGDATEVMLHLDDNNGSKEIGKKIHDMIKEIYDAYEVMVFHEKPKE